VSIGLNFASRVADLRYSPVPDSATLYGVLVAPVSMLDLAERVAAATGLNVAPRKHDAHATELVE